MAEARNAAALILLVHDRPGALAKIANVFSRRGLNIRTLSVTPSATADHSRIVVGVDGACGDWQRVALAIGNLIDVVAVEVGGGD